MKLSNCRDRTPFNGQHCGDGKCDWLQCVDSLSDIKNPSRKFAYQLPDDTIWVLDFENEKWIEVTGGSDGSGGSKPTLIYSDDGYINVSGNGSYKVDLGLNETKLKDLIQQSGIAGPKGEKGDAGAPGEKGDTGAPGVKGEDGASGISEALEDGKVYGRKNGDWVEITGGSCVGSTIPIEVDVNGQEVNLRIVAPYGSEIDYSNYTVKAANNGTTVDLEFTTEYYHTYHFVNSEVQLDPIERFDIFDENDVLVASHPYYSAQSNGEGVEEAPKDGKQYARKDGTWTEVTSAPAGTTPIIFTATHGFTDDKIMVYGRGFETLEASDDWATFVTVKDSVTGALSNIQPVSKNYIDSTKTVAWHFELSTTQTAITTYANSSTGGGSSSWIYEFDYSDWNVTNPNSRGYIMNKPVTSQSHSGLWSVSPIPWNKNRPDYWLPFPFPEMINDNEMYQLLELGVNAITAISMPARWYLTSSSAKVKYSIGNFENGVWVESKVLNASASSGATVVLSISANDCIQVTDDVCQIWMKISASDGAFLESTGLAPHSSSVNVNEMVGRLPQGNMMLFTGQLAGGQSYLPPTLQRICIYGKLSPKLMTATNFMNLPKLTTVLNYWLDATNNPSSSTYNFFSNCPNLKDCYVGISSDVSNTKDVILYQKLERQ
ncbi:hypothetical protein M2139_001626 [Enterococcus sp. PF1-24]|uniref:hypothetical protein n=1 Tax=unclassified Enterococcus TaxID=2608891 RepID=UPI002472F9E7|nr:MULTISPECIES: hypothetical protein [unclassified Enterococcus]MDH6364639.1 hypothetical protein [Enterococcus sp. PFB1-1]MDH6401740.1 hypothetical protein [Enterococcus sp. PF1-24]